MEREIQQMIGEWRTQQRIGNIKNLKLSRYNFLPTEYHVIFDDRLLITGLYTPNKEADSKVDVEDPLLIDNATTDGEQIIKRYILRFDSFENDVNAS
ncbi:hypothetical protein [Dyadobacter bucti]|uniref:hypothetical protein n=1 Tax=Dyadobacter bucti TaxID=2572203 RepID=UPI003F70182D